MVATSSIQWVTTHWAQFFKRTKTKSESMKNCKIHNIKRTKNIKLYKQMNKSLKEEEQLKLTVIIISIIHSERYEHDIFGAYT